MITTIRRKPTRLCE